MQNLQLQLEQLKHISTEEEWLVFVLAYYEKLSLKEISKVLEKDIQYINTVLDNVLQKAQQCLLQNMKYLYQ